MSTNQTRTKRSNRAAPSKLLHRTIKILKTSTRCRQCNGPIPEAPLEEAYCWPCRQRQIETAYEQVMNTDL